MAIATEWLVADEEHEDNERSLYLYEASGEYGDGYWFCTVCNKYMDSNHIGRNRT